MAISKQYKSEYSAWINMKHRCLNPKHPQYNDYGGRGIKVCNEWLHDFSQFLSDVGVKPSSSLTLDRINNDGNYEPGNVEWRTRSQQQNNRRPMRIASHNRIITHKGVSKTLADWASELGIKRSTLQGRLDSGWSISKALTEPTRPYTT